MRRNIHVLLINIELVHYLPVGILQSILFNLCIKWLTFILFIFKILKFLLVKKAGVSRMWLVTWQCSRIQSLQLTMAT